MTQHSALIYLGRINGVHGVRGWVKIHSECRPRDAIFSYREFIACQGRRKPSQIPLKLLDGRCQGKGLVAHFAGINDRDSAYTLHGLSLYVPRDALSEPSEDEYYWADLIGLRVVNQQGECLGHVENLFETGANDVMIVKDEYKQEILIPFITPTYICQVDFAQQTIHVDWLRAWSEEN